MVNSTQTPLTKEQKKAYDRDRASFFKGSIAVMVIYGTIILMFGLIGVFSESGRYFLFAQNFGFTVTFIGGVILIITLMLVQLLTYKPITKKEINYDELICPDYWELKKVTPGMKTLINKKWQPWANYYCQAPSYVSNISSTTILPTEEVTAVEKEYKKAFVDFNKVDGLTANPMVDSSVAMSCGRIYPEYMNKRDADSFPDEPNSLRCKFVKQCGVNNVTWTGVCPNPK